MKTTETRPFAEGKLNDAFARIAVDYFKDHCQILESLPTEPYEVEAEQAKFQQADLVIFQYPIFWFNMPSSLKKYLDDIYQYGVFFDGSDPYGSGGLMGGNGICFR